MRQSFTDANISQIHDMCLNSDQAHLKQLIEGVYDTIYGLDYVVDDQRRTLLHLLAENPKFTNWETLLKAFVYIDSTDSNLQTPLHISIQNKNLEAMDILLQNGANPAIEDEHGINPIQLAFQMNYCDGLIEMLKFFSVRQYINTNPLKIGRICIEHNALDAFRVFLDFLPTKLLNVTDEDGYALIHYATMQNAINFINELIEHHVDVNQKVKIDKFEKTALELIEINTESKATAEFLLANGCTFNKKNQPNLLALENESKKWEITGRSIMPCELHRMAVDGNIQAIMTYTGDKIDVTDAMGRTPLIYALLYQRFEFVSVLVNQKHADPAKFTGCTTAFHIAALKGYGEQFKLFLNFKPIKDVTMLDNENRSLVVCAVQGGNAEILQIILDSGFNHESYTMDIVDKLLVPYFPVGEIATVLFRHGFLITTKCMNGKSLLWNSIDKDKIDLAEAIIAFNKNNENDLEIDDCLIHSIISQKQNFISLFINAGANPLIQYLGHPLAFTTISFPTTEILEGLIQLHPEIRTITDPTGNTFLHHACQLCSARIVNYALDRLNIDVNSTNRNGETPLHLLLFEYNKDFEQIFCMLMEKGARLDLKNDKKQNILHMIADHNCVQVMERFIGNNPNKQNFIDAAQANQFLCERDSDGLTPLEIASRKPDAECAELISRIHHLPIFDTPLTRNLITEYIVNGGYSPNIRNKDGLPLISYAMQNYQTNPVLARSMVTRLIELGANPSLADTTELTPLHYAIQHGDVELVKLLVDKGSTFLIGPVIHSYIEEKGVADKLEAIIKLPERRESAINEILTIQSNAIPICQTILTMTNRISEKEKTMTYIDDVKRLLRFLIAFVDRLEKIIHHLTPTTEIGRFLIYFADSLLPLIGMGVTYGQSIDEINASTEASILDEASGYLHGSYNDIYIVPTQLFQRYSDLIKAVIKNTPQGHPDLPLLQKANAKYAYIGRSLNDRKMIVDSQKELKSMRLITRIDDRITQFNLDDILYFKGQFDKIRYEKPKIPSMNTGVDSLDWGLKNVYANVGGLKLQFFNTFGSSMTSFLEKNRVAICLFRNTILIGVQKTYDKFKLKFSCRSTEVIWDFGKENGPECLSIYTPFGLLVLKVLPPKGTLPNYERQQWESNAKKAGQYDETEAESIEGFEIVYASFVCEETGCVHSQLFKVSCSNKEEAKQKILSSLSSMGINVKTRINALGETIQLINYDFQTYKKGEGEISDVLSDTTF